MLVPGAWVLSGLRGAVRRAGVVVREALRRRPAARGALVLGSASSIWVVGVGFVLRVTLRLGRGAWAPSHQQTAQREGVGGAE